MSASLRTLRPHQTKALQLLGENWRPVVGYEGAYEVSDIGRVKALARTFESVNRWGSVSTKFLKPRIVAQTEDAGRYAYGRLQVKIRNPETGLWKTHLVHRLVAAAFIGEAPEGCEVAHNDGDAKNNRASNLRYATPKENSEDKRRHGTILRGDSAPWSKITSDDVTSIRNEAGRVTYREMSEKYGISQGQISRIVNGSRWGAGR